MNTESTLNSVGPFSLDTLMALTKPQRNWVLTMFLSSMEADDLATKVADPINSDVTFADLIAVGALQQYQRVRAMREGVGDAVVGGQTVSFRGRAFDSPADLAGHMGKARKNGRSPKYGLPILYRVDDEGTLTPLAELLKGPAHEHAEQRTERERIRLLLRAVGKPIHLCPRCGEAEREVKRSRWPLDTSKELVTLFCGHMLRLRISDAA